MLYYIIYKAPHNVAKSSIELNGPSQGSEVWYFFMMGAAKNVWLLPLATGFVRLIHIFHIIPQVVRSFNITCPL